MNKVLSMCFSFKLSQECDCCISPGAQILPIEIFRGRTVRKDHYGTSRAGQAEELAVGHAVDTLFTILMYSILSMAYACPSFFVR